MNLAFTTDPSLALWFSRGMMVCNRVDLDIQMLRSRENDLREAWKRANFLGVNSYEGRKALKNYHVLKDSLKRLSRTIENECRALGVPASELLARARAASKAVFDAHNITRVTGKIPHPPAVEIQWIASIGK